MTTGSLAVWLYGMKVALIERERRGRTPRLHLAYTPEAIARFSLGSPILSLSLPMTPVRYGNALVRSFVDGLLPEGDLRPIIAAKLGLVASDAYEMIAALGRDCAGALVIQSDDLPSPDSAPIAEPQRLSEQQIGERLANLRDVPLGISGEVRVSLAGVQEKLLLTRLPSGGWCSPEGGIVSTHILKPRNVRFPQLVENEAFCMRLARELGLPVARIDVATFAGQQVLAVERYDRRRSADGAIDRIHQEDCCQALGLGPGQKYEEDGGPSLARIAGVVQSAAGAGSVEALFRAVALNVLIGNGDAHGKNFSVLHPRAGGIELAPLYDLVCTAVYFKDARLAMAIDHVQRINRVTRERLLNEAVHWGMSRQRVTGLLDDLLDRVPAAVVAARAATPGLADDVPELVASRLTQLAAA